MKLAALASFSVDPHSSRVIQGAAFMSANPDALIGENKMPHYRTLKKPRPVLHIPGILRLKIKSDAMERDDQFNSTMEPYHSDDKLPSRVLIVIMIFASMITISFAVNAYQLLRWAFGG